MDYANAKNFKTAQQTPIKRGWLATKDLQLQVNIGTFMLEPWERNLVSMSTGPFIFVRLAGCWVRMGKLRERRREGDEL